MTAAACAAGSACWIWPAVPATGGKFSRMVGEQGQVVLADINDSMLKMGREKLRDRGIVGNINYVQANAEALPFPDNYFDCITISFGLRNVTDKDKALRSMFRVLKPGGRLLVLEFSKPLLAPLSKAYDAYSFHVLPKIGELVVKDPDSYRYRRNRSACTPIRKP